MKITVYAGLDEAGKDGRASSVQEYDGVDVTEKLRTIGLEYKSADYFQTRQVIIVIDPDKAEPEAKEDDPMMEAVKDMLDKLPPEMKATYEQVFKMLRDMGK